MKKSKKSSSTKLHNIFKFDKTRRTGLVSSLCYKIYYFFKDLPSNVKYFFHRGKNGINDRDVWDFDAYLCDVIVKGLTILKKDQHGHPCDLTEKEWKKILNKIIRGFDLAKNSIIDPRLRAKNYQKIHSGFVLLEKYFFHLWD